MSHLSWFKLGQGSFINDITQIWDFCDPLPSLEFSTFCVSLQDYNWSFITIEWSCIDIITLGFQSRVRLNSILADFFNSNLDTGVYQSCFLMQKREFYHLFFCFLLCLMNNQIFSQLFVVCFSTYLLLLFNSFMSKSTIV